MELREAFDIADTDKGGALELDEFIEAFGAIIGKGMNHKQLQQLFMRIDADSNGSVEWHEFMNYMLLENQTLSSMKQEHSEYLKSQIPDPAPHKINCHSDMITSIFIILPNPEEVTYNPDRPEPYRRKMKYVTGSRDGKIKIWNAFTMKLELNGEITVVKDIWVTCISYMTLSLQLIAGSANRMISFYDLKNTQNHIPVSRIEGLVGIPLCLEYYQWPDNNNDSNLETILVGDDLGICHMYTIKESDWHICNFKIEEQEKQKKTKINDKGEKVEVGSSEPMVRRSVEPMVCCKEKIIAAYKLETEKIFNKNEEKKKADRKNLNKKELGATATKKDDEVKEKTKTIRFEGVFDGVEEIEKLIHKGWITKIKFYPDLNYVISSSLDGMIHIHDIENLKYRDNKTFNIHQKGVNSFIYSSMHRFIASCGEERHILMWDPFTLGVLAYLYGHNTSVQDLALNEERNHLISLGTDKVVKIWHTISYGCT